MGEPVVVKPETLSKIAGDTAAYHERKAAEKGHCYPSYTEDNKALLSIYIKILRFFKRKYNADEKQNNDRKDI